MFLWLFSTFRPPGARARLAQAQACPNSRSVCKDLRCRGAIRRGELRLGKVAPSLCPSGFSRKVAWYHVDCLFEAFKRVSVCGCSVASRFSRERDQKRALGACAPRGAGPGDGSERLAGGVRAAVRRVRASSRERLAADASAARSQRPFTLHACSRRTSPRRSRTSAT
ncbi:hypothetical protein M885DRAFT_185979 [Pelagophyceae sp. CCMP2097]|nr:hypothetical protein M885DRAFT_185979 [Pelagophyceae sp. CCMP2097]